MPSGCPCRLYLLGFRLADVGGLNQGTGVLSGPVIRLDKQVFDLSEPGGQLVLVRDLARGVFDNSGRTAGVKLQ